MKTVLSSLVLAVWLLSAQATQAASFFGSEETELHQQRQTILAAGYGFWEWQKSDCFQCDVVFFSTHEQLQTVKVQQFLRALENSKAEILHLYGSDSQEYNLLAHMAIGILGRESLFFKSWRYSVKENFQGTIGAVKAIRAYLSDSTVGPSENSRGPTQIKIVPKKIAEHYGIESEELWVPENAARATIGFLIEALRELKQRALNNEWDHINEQTYVDFLPYIYFGSIRELKNGTATPDRNIYIQDMKRYMSWVEVYEKQRENPLP